MLPWSEEFEEEKENGNGDEKNHPERHSEHSISPCFFGLVKQKQRYSKGCQEKMELIVTLFHDHGNCCVSQDNQWSLDPIENLPIPGEFFIIIHFFLHITLEQSPFGILFWSFWNFFDNSKKTCLLCDGLG